MTNDVRFLGCGDSLRDTTVGVRNRIADLDCPKSSSNAFVAGDAVFALALFQPIIAEHSSDLAVVITACRRGPLPSHATITFSAPRLWLFRNYPPLSFSGALAKAFASSTTPRCISLRVDPVNSGTLFFALKMVEVEGPYEIFINCPLPSLPPSPLLLLNSSGALERCPIGGASGHFLACGDVLHGTTGGARSRIDDAHNATTLIRNHFRNESGRTSSVVGDAIFALALFRPGTVDGATVTVKITACSLKRRGNSSKRFNGRRRRADGTLPPTTLRAPRLWLFNGHPALFTSSTLTHTAASSSWSLATMTMATSGEREILCTALRFDALGRGTIFIALEMEEADISPLWSLNGAIPHHKHSITSLSSTEGPYDISVDCRSPPPEPQPPLPHLNLSDPCEFRFLACGEDLESMLWDSSPIATGVREELFMVSVWHRHTVVFSTCLDAIDSVHFNAPHHNASNSSSTDGANHYLLGSDGAIELQLWDGMPPPLPHEGEYGDASGDTNAPRLLRHSNPVHLCGFLTHFFDSPGSYWLKAVRRSGHREVQSHHHHHHRAPHFLDRTEKVYATLFPPPELPPAVHEARVLQYSLEMRCLDTADAIGAMTPMPIDTASTISDDNDDEAKHVAKNPRPPYVNVSCGTARATGGVVASSRHAPPLDGFRIGSVAFAVRRPSPPSVASTWGSYHDDDGGGRCVNSRRACQPPPPPPLRPVSVALSVCSPRTTAPFRAGATISVFDGWPAGEPSNYHRNSDDELHREGDKESAGGWGHTQWAPFGDCGDDTPLPELLAVSIPSTGSRAMSAAAIWDTASPHSGMGAWEEASCGEEGGALFFDLTSDAPVIYVVVEPPRAGHRHHLSSSQGEDDTGLGHFTDFMSSRYYGGAGGSMNADWGLVELTAICEPLSGLPTSPANTCGTPYVACGDAKLASTVGFPSFVGHADSGDALFLFTAFEPTRVAFTTCSGLTDFATRLLLFDGTPVQARHRNGGSVEDANGRDGDEDLSSHNAQAAFGAYYGGNHQRINSTTLLATSDDRYDGAAAGGEDCGTLIHDLTAPGTYYLIVEGQVNGDRNAGGEGYFELSVGCDALPSNPIDESCGYNYV